MSGRRPSQNRGRPQKPAARYSPPPPPVQRPAPQPKPVYGPPFILLEDERKNTFEFVGGAWVPYARTIAECRLDCQVKELSQKVNKMTRYEVRPAIS
ncbi:MAG: hypothetical protein QM775_14250 [Pirellulales bacterium]